MVGAILTQNTNWGNVEKAINNLKKEKLLTLDAFDKITQKKLATLIRPSGYFNQKSKRLKDLVAYIKKNYNGSLTKFFRQDTYKLREELLSLKGIGPETADSILLYAAKKPVFVIDAYTKRVLMMHGIATEDSSYDEMQAIFMDNLKHDTKVFNEYHALIVRLAKEHCKKREPVCNVCPLEGML